MKSLTIRTREECWVVPEHFEIVKLMILKRQFEAHDLRFLSHQERQCFAKRLALMALQDECKYRRPSVIGEVCRSLVAKRNQSNRLNRKGVH